MRWPIRSSSTGNNLHWMVGPVTISLLGGAGDDTLLGGDGTIGWMAALVPMSLVGGAGNDLYG